MVGGNEKTLEACASGFPPPGDAPAAGPRQWLVLALCALATLVFYLLLVRVAPGLPETTRSRSETVLPWVPPARPPAARGTEKDAGAFWKAPLGYCALLVGLFAAYGVTLRTVAGRSSGALEAAVFGLGALLLALLAAAPLLFSNDVYLYATFGRVFAFHHVDPAVDVSVLPPDDVYLRLWSEDPEPTPYGPLWTLIAGGVAWLGGARVGLTVLLFRGVAAAGVLGASVVIWYCLRRVAPHRAAQGLAFFLWNPLVLLEAGLSAHNDALMIGLFLAGVGMHVRGRPSLAMPFFTLSALTKFATVPLVPIYLLMALRQLPDWRARCRFLAAAAAGAALTAAVVVGLVRLGTRGWSGPAPGAVVPQAVVENVFVQKYTHSIHELLFRGLRRWLGEEPEEVRDVEFIGWWVATREGMGLRSAADEAAPALARLEPDTPLLVIAPSPPESPWVRVYDPATGRKGYVPEDATRVYRGPDGSEQPPVAQADPALIRWELGRSPTAVRADAWLRRAGWSAFGLAWLGAAWYARDLRRFLVGSAALMLASYWLIASWFFPWYVLWALAFAALVPTSPPALLAALLSATVLTLYASTGFEKTGATQWVCTYRSLPALGLPLLLFGLASARRWRPRPRDRRG
jgi:hypothetical protein